jgi:hypothetical protein
MTARFPVCDMAGHMTLRMLDEWYTWRKVKDQRQWEDAMPLNISNVTHGWQGFLLECVILAIWPTIKQTLPKEDLRFQKLIEILKAAEVKRDKIKFF